MAIYLTINEASDLINMARSTIRKKVTQKLLPAYKPGKRLLFLEEDLHKFVKRAKI